MNAKWTHKINDTSGVWLFEPICEQSIWIVIWIVIICEYREQAEQKKTDD